MRTRPTIDIDQEFSKNLDQILQGETAEACDSVSDEYRATLEFAEMLARSKPFPRPTFQDGLKRSLMARLENVRRPLRPMARAESGWRVYWRPALAATLSVCLLAGIFFAFPPAQSWAQGVIRAVMGKLIVTGEQTWAERIWPEFESGEYEKNYERVPEDWPRRWTLDELQEKIDFPLLLPSYLPEGYHQDSLIPIPLLSPSTDDEPAQHQFSYRGIQVIYSDGSPDGTICLNEGKLAGTKRFPVGQAGVREVVVRGVPAVWVEGAPLALKKSGFPVGQITRNLEAMNVLLWEEGGIGFELSTTDLDLPLEEMLRIAESMSRSD